MMPKPIALASVLLIFVSTCEMPSEPPPIVSPVDTTSHIVAWSIDSVAESGGFNDVAILDEFTVWGVGVFFLRDSTGAWDPVPFNLATWNGSSWSVTRVPYNYQGMSFFNEITAIHANSATDVWLCGNGIIHWDGTAFNEVPIPPSSVWGPSQIRSAWSTGALLYMGGDDGELAVWDGSMWKKITTGVATTIRDIWGAFNSRTSSWEILAATSSSSQILQIQDLTATAITNVGLPNSLSSIWFIPDQSYFAVGYGVRSKSTLDISPWLRTTGDTVKKTYSSSVRGTATNDVFVAGSSLDIVHFNGATWHNYIDQLSASISILSSIDVNGSLIVAVGYSTDSGIAVIGRRNK